MRVELIDVMGSDLTVVNAARVSFDKHHDVFEDPKDTKLISYLANHGHWTPFSHPQIQFRLTTALFVAAQLKRHVVGFALNEVSRRYVDSEPEFESLVFRQRHESAKQGSADEFEDVMQEELQGQLGEVHELCLGRYEEFLAAGVAPEQARAVLPQTMMTSWYWTGSLYAWANLCRQRLDPHAQVETRAVAVLISAEMERLFPVCWEKLVDDHFRD